MSTPTLVISDRDSRKLLTLLEESYAANELDRTYWDALETELKRATVVPSEQVPGNVVKMGSRVRITDMRTGQKLVFRVVFPHEANYAEHKISVLAPIGMALLGYSAGTEITWTVPSGTRRLRIEAVEHQDQEAQLHAAA